MISFTKLLTPIISVFVWAEQNKIYAITADVPCLFYSTIGMPIVASNDTPLVEYVREYWESENDIPFCFMDWVKLDLDIN